jgi:hypothetical protein
MCRTFNCPPWAVGFERTSTPRLRVGLIIVIPSFPDAGHGFHPVGLPAKFHMRIAEHDVRAAVVPTGYVIVLTPTDVFARQHGIKYSTFCFWRQVSAARW